MLAAVELERSCHTSAQVCLGNCMWLGMLMLLKLCMLRRAPTNSGSDLGDGGCERGLAVIHVPNGADGQVRFGVAVDVIWAAGWGGGCCCACNDERQGCMLPLQSAAATWCPMPCWPARRHICVRLSLCCWNGSHQVSCTPVWGWGTIHQENGAPEGMRGSWVYSGALVSLEKRLGSGLGAGHPGAAGGAGRGQRCHPHPGITLRDDCIDAL